MIWKPSKTLGLLVGLLMLLTLVGVQVLLVHSLCAQEAGVSAYLTALQLLIFLPLLIRWLGSYYGLITLSYDVDSESLVIHCGLTHYRVPLGSIRDVLPGHDVRMSESFRGVGWPGYLAGRAQLERLGNIIVCSTEPIERQTVIVTDSGCYGISPREVPGFLSALESERSSTVQGRAEPQVIKAGLAAWPVWRDRGFWITVCIALLANLLLFGAVSSRYDMLPQRFSVWGSTGQDATRVVAKEDLYLLPVAGTAMLMANTLVGLLVHRRERVAAHILAACSFCMQAPLWTAVLSVLNR